MSTRQEILTEMTLSNIQTQCEDNYHTSIQEEHHQYKTLTLHLSCSTYIKPIL